MISIIIPTHNRAHLIERAINSVLNQTFKDWELIIVDDGSTDNTEEVIKKFLIDNRIKYVKKENSGAADSRNVGVKYSKYKYITFLDSDDEAKSDWLKAFYNILINERPALISCGVEIIDENNAKKKILLPASMKLFPKGKYKITNGGSFLLDKTYFLKIGGYDPTFKANQHTELSYRLIPYLFNKNAKIEHINKSLIKIHIHQGERIRFDWNAVYEGTNKMINKHLNLLLNDKELLSNYYAVLANTGYRIGRKRKEVLANQWHSIKYNPLKLKNHLRFLKYLLLK